MIPDQHPLKDPFSGKPNQPKLGLLLHGVFRALVPIMLIWPVYRVVTAGYGLLAFASMAVSLYGAWSGIRDIRDYLKRRGAFEQEMRDYRSALARAVDFTQA